MIRDIMLAWDLDKSESFDPFIGLIIEALSAEIYTLTDNVTNIEVRLLDKLAKVLTPAIRTTAQPAHAILITRPLEPKYLLTKEHPAYYDDTASNKLNKVSNVIFSPVCDVPVFNGYVAYLICNGTFYSVNEKAEKSVLEKFPWEYTLNNAWIGLIMDKSIDSLKGLSFYIDFPHIRNRNEYLNLLQFTNWRIGNRIAKTKQGLDTSIAKSDGSLSETLSEYGIMGIIDKTIYKLYSKRFVSIDEDCINKPSVYPSELEPIIAQSETMQDQLNQPLLWVQVSFPQSFISSILDDMTICINAVPIAQKALKSKNQALIEHTNIIRLNVNENEHFLSVHSVTDSQNKQYREFLSDSSPDNGIGTYAIRHGGCERFDSRDAKDYLYRLQDLLMEERAMFTSESKSKMTDITEQLLVLINRMEEAAASMEESREVPHYLIIDVQDTKGNIKTEYWITNGTIGNGISAGVPLIPFPQTPLDVKYSFLLTTSAGGKKPPSPEEKIWHYKKALLSGERIVTNEDIKCFCQAEYPGIFDHIEIRRGTAISKRPQDGLIRTTDVHLLVASRFANEIKEENLVWTLEEKLKDKSPESYNYRIIIEYKE